MQKLNTSELTKNNIMAAKLRWKVFLSAHLLCKFVNKKKIKVISISDYGESYTLFYIKNKDI